MSISRAGLYLCWKGWKEQFQHKGNLLLFIFIAKSASFWFFNNQNVFNKIEIKFNKKLNNKSTWTKNLCDLLNLATISKYKTKENFSTV